LMFIGMVYVNPETPYMKLFEKFLEKKFRTAVDAWGADESHVAPVWDPLEKFIADNVPEKYYTQPCPTQAFLEGPG
jgi:hypothetical protein